MSEQDALVVLNAIPGIGNRTIHQLLVYFGSARQVFTLSVPELCQAQGIPQDLAQKISDFPRDTFLKSEYNLIAQKGARVVTIFDAEYPSCLREIPDAPVVLYLHGQMPRSPFAGLAMVGSRRSSVYGQQTARKISGRLAELGITIVSGLARGVDAAAHEGCLQAQGVTLAILGSGLANLYPAEHAKLAQRIAEKGAVISEFPMTMPPLAHNFPRRNRIISGLALGVLVVEAARKSGALITARFALEQGRDVFALPGPVDSPNSLGVHDLIRQGARLVSNVDDILEELAIPLKTFLQESVASAQEVPPAVAQSEEFSDDDKRVLDKVRDTPTYLDEVIAQSGLARNRVLSAILNLELRLRVRQLPGNYFVRSQERVSGKN